MVCRRKIGMPMQRSQRMGGLLGHSRGLLRDCENFVGLRFQLLSTASSSDQRWASQNWYSCSHPPLNRSINLRWSPLEVLKSSYRRWTMASDLSRSGDHLSPVQGGTLQNIKKYSSPKHKFSVTFICNDKLVLKKLFFYQKIFNFWN